LGVLDGYSGLIDAARVDLESGLAVARRLNNRLWEGGILANLGNVQYAQGRLVEASASYEAGIQIAREIGNRQWEGNALCNLGLMCQLQGDADAARRHLEGSLQVARQIGHVRLEEVTRFNLGITEQQAANFDAAQQHFGSALRIAQTLRDERSCSQIVGFLGLLQCQRGNPVEGRSLIAQSKERFEAAGDDSDLAMVLCQSAEAYLLEGNVEAARRDFEDATRTAAASIAPYPSEVAAALSRVRSLLGDQKEVVP
jgi:tetratricopeptide (TPR) repeat protein